MSDSSDPLAIFRILAEAGVPFVIVGGHAVAFHGYVRTTEDADVLFVRTHDSEQALLHALKEMHACWISNERDVQTGVERTIPVTGAYVQSSRLMMLTTDAGFLDLFDHVPGFPDVAVQELIEDAVVFEGLRFVSRRWLCRMKQRAGRHRDLDDLEHLDSDDL